MITVPQALLEQAKAFADAVILFENGMSSDEFLEFVAQEETDMLEWAKKAIPDAYKAAAKTHEHVRAQ